jgi:predicted nucleic acid-binding protein
MPFVLDASMTMQWCFDDESTPASDAIFNRLRDDEAYVPAIWAYEVANVLLSAERRGRISAQTATRFLHVLDSLPIRISAGPTITELSPLISLAHHNQLSAYDAAYLDLAMRSGYFLATGDERLRKAAARVGVDLLGS